MLKVARKIIIGFIVFVAVSCCLFLGFLAWGGRDAAILMYHTVGAPLAKKNTLNVSEGAFEKQMKFLYTRRYHVIPLSDYVRLLAAKKKIPPKTIVITFDDGFANNYTTAFPILKKYHFPATVFIIVDSLGQKKFMTAGMVKELSTSGLIEIGAHTRTHPYLPDIKNEAVLEEEISGSKRFLEELLKKPVEAFCYPKGGYTAAIERLVQKAGYRVAVTTLPKRKGFAHRDIFALKRIKITEASKDQFIFFIETSGYYLRMKEMFK